MSGENEESVVSRFYDNKVIFITGGTGFMGKVIVEKLLHCCPGIKKVYVLVRPKKGEDKNLRLENIKKGQVFKDLSNEYPDRLSKLEGLEGDIELPGLGLSQSDRQLLRQVNVVFNVAATINFNEELRQCMLTNIMAVKTLLDLCLEIKHLESFVHVSTAYSNCDHKYIEEKVYPAPMDPQELLQMLRESPDHLTPALTARLLGDRPNTYVLTKALGESVVQGYADKFPVGIVRPSVVTPSARTPRPGWVDCRSGCTGLLAAAAGGLLRVLYADRAIVFDIVPVDLADNVIIVAGWKTARLGCAPPAVYHAVSGAANQLVLSDLFDLVVLYSKEMPQDFVLWYPAVAFTKNRLVYNICNFWLHKVPAYVYDYVVAPFSKIRLIRAQQGLQRALPLLEFFGSNDFQFAYDNIPRLLAEMNERDKELFPIDIKQVNWFTYTATYAQGIRKYLLGQKDEDLPRARKRMKILYYKDRVVKVLVAAVAYYVAVTWATPLLTT